MSEPVVKKVTLRGDIAVKDCHTPSRRSGDPCYHLVDEENNTRIHMDKNSLRSLRAAVNAVLTEDEPHDEEPRGTLEYDPVVACDDIATPENPFRPLATGLKRANITPAQAAFYAYRGRFPRAKDGPVSRAAAKLYNVSPNDIRHAEDLWARGEYERALEQYASEALIPNVNEGLNAIEQKRRARFVKEIRKATRGNSKLRKFVGAAFISAATAATVLYGSAAWNALYALLSS